MSFSGTRIAPVLTVTKSASAPVLVAGATGQSYTVTINVAYAPTTATITIADLLPAGITTSGAITINATNSGLLSGCASAGATSLAGCTIAAGASSPIVLTVPVSVAAGTANPVSNTATVSGGGDTTCPAGANCTDTYSAPVISAVNDVDSKAPGVASSTNVSANDKFPANATFTVTGGTCSAASPATPASNTTGVLGYTAPLVGTNCTVLYKVCAPSPNSTVCASATLTVTPIPTTIAVSKAMGSVRVADTDQFTVQIKNSSNGVVNATGNSTTTGTGSAVSGGSTGTFNATAGTAYTLTEVAASGNLVQYTSTVSCSNSTAGGTDVSTTTPLGRTITPALGDAISCVITNTLARFALNGKVILDNGAGSGVAHDAVQNGTEPALAGIPLSLTNCAATVYSATTSAADGSFSLNLTGVPASQPVCMVQTLPGNYAPVSANPGNAPGVLTTTGSRSTTLKFTPAAYTNYDGVVLGNVTISTLTGDAEQQTTPGSALTYSHLYTAGSAGSVRFATTDNPSPVGLVWSSVLYRDTNCNGVLDSSDTLLTAAITVTAGQRICLLNRVLSPAGAPSGVKDLTTLSATETWSVPTLSPNNQSNVMQNTDTTKVGTGGLTLLKEVRKLGANCPLDAKASTDDTTPYTLAGSTKPGDALEYRLTYVNNTAAPMTAIKLNDSVPAFTLFRGALCLSWPKSISDCTVAQQPALDAVSGSIVWVMLDNSTSSVGLQPLDSGTVSFCVKVQQ